MIDKVNKSLITSSRTLRNRELQQSKTYNIKHHQPYDIVTNHILPDSTRGHSIQDFLCKGLMETKKQTLICDLFVIWLLVSMFTPINYILHSINFNIT